MNHVSAGSHCLLRQASWTSKDNKSLYVIIAVMTNINKTVTFVQTPTKCRASIADMYGYAYCNSPTTHEFSRKSCHTARGCANTALMCEAFLSNGVPCEVLLVRIFIRSVSARACFVKLCCVKLCNALASSVAMCCVVLRCVSLRSGFLFAAWRKDPCFVF